MQINFTGKATPLSALDIQNAVNDLGGDIASLWALLAVETQGFGFLSDRRPCILFERHVFHERTGGNFDAYPNLSNPEPGGYLGGEGEYDRLQKAMGLDETAALESTSWGLAQVMGFNAFTIGYSNVRDMIEAMVDAESAQLTASAAFIMASAPLWSAFQSQDWPGVALHYNGPDYERNHYATRLEQSYDLFSTSANCPDIDVRTAQACLLYLGYSFGEVDGRMGPRTRQAVRAFCLARGLQTGDLDPTVLNVLSAEAEI